MNEEEIKEMYEKGIVQIAPMMEHLIEKYKEDKFNLDIQQCQILIHYLLNEHEFDENYIDELENEIDKEKEKNRRNKRIALNKLEKLKNGIENDFPIKLGEQQPLWEDSYTKFISKDKIRDLIVERKFELQQEYKDFEDDIKLNTLEELLEE